MSEKRAPVDVERERVMWHALDGFWTAFHGLPKPVYMSIETVCFIAGIMALGLATPRAARVRAFMARWWIVPAAIGLAAAYVGVSHDVWTHSQRDHRSLHHFILRGSAAFSFGAYLLALDMLIVFFIEWGWMTEEKEPDER